MDWDKQVLAWKEKVGVVEIPMQIDKSDMLKAIMSEGDFVFKGTNGGYTLMNLRDWKGSSKKDFKLLEKVLWKQVIEYVTEKQTLAHKIKEKGALLE